jgi:hypothetical protein
MLNGRTTRSPILTLHTTTDLDDLPHVLVTERPAYFEGRPPLVHVEVRATDVRRRHLTRTSVGRSIFASGTSFVRT